MKTDSKDKQQTSGERQNEEIRNSNTVARGEVTGENSEVARQNAEEERLADRLEDERTNPRSAEVDEQTISAIEHSNLTGANVPVEHLQGDLKEESRKKAERIAGVESSK